MKSILFAILFVVLNVMVAKGQTTAVDFTAMDCGGTSRTLFTELDAGKIIVLVWVEPCVGCISDAKIGYDAVNSFGGTHPGRVLYWLSDDIGNTTCTALRTWAGANGILTLGLTVFDNTGNVINEADYGGTGMPHVVVIGGTDHHIFYNQLSGSNDSIAIVNAINTALSSSTGVENTPKAAGKLTLFPNPSKGKISINYGLDNAAPISIEVYDEIGRKAKTVDIGKQSIGQHSLDLNFDTRLSPGTYFVKLRAGDVSQIAKFTIVD